MDSSDESFVAQGAGLGQRVFGKQAVNLIDPIGRKALDKKKDEEDKIKEREAAEAAQIAEDERTVTATPLTQQTDLERRNRRLRASVLTRNFAQPTLGSAGSLGVR